MDRDGAKLRSDREEIRMLFSLRVSFVTSRSMRPINRMFRQPAPLLSKY
jgi:hypothetical protein